MRQIVSLMLAIVFCLYLGAAQASSSSALAREAPRQNFTFFVKVFRNVQTPFAGTDPQFPRSPSDPIWLRSCNSSSDFVGDDSGPTSDVADIAYDYVYIKSYLRGLYPKAAWEPLLGKYVDSALQAVAAGQRYKQQELQHNLAVELNDYRRDHSRNLPVVSSRSNGCGDGEIMVHLSSRPGNGHIKYINKIYVRLCKEQKIDVHSTDCDHWRDFSDDSRSDSPGEAPSIGAALMAGAYLVTVQWPDGSSTDRELDVDTLSNKQGNDVRYVIAK